MSPVASRTNWRTPLVVVLCGCLIAVLTFGPRSTFGFFMQPMSKEFAWGRDVFAFAFAFQNLLWGIGQPFAGAIADRFGTVRVIAVGGLMYAAGLALMRYSDTPLALNATVGVLIGFGLAGCSFNLVVSAFAKIVPQNWRARRARRRHRCRLVRPVSVRTVRCRAARQFRLADDADDLRGADAAGGAAGACAGDAQGRAGASAGAPRAGPAIVQACAVGSVRPPILCAAGARLLHLRLSTRVRHRAPAGLSARPRARRIGRRLGDRDHRPVQHRRLARRRLAREVHADALHPVGDLRDPRAVDPGLHLVPDHAGDGRHLRHRHRRHLALHRAADQSPWSR